MPAPLTRTLLRTGVVLLLLAALSAVWEFLSRQSPMSPYFAGALPGPVGDLHQTLVILGLALLAVAPIAPIAYPEEKPRWPVWVLHAGVVVVVTAMTYAATKGMYGVHLTDPRPLSLVLVYGRVAGSLMLGVVLVDFAVRLWRALGRK